MDQGKQRLFRMGLANALLQVIGTCGREFFKAKNGTIAGFYIKDGRLWFSDRTGADVYMHQPQGARWRGFSEGGTLKSLVYHLKEFIWNGTRLPDSQLGPWPQWYSDGDPWGYGESMRRVRAAGMKLEITQSVDSTNHTHAAA